MLTIMRKDRYLSFGVAISEALKARHRLYIVRNSKVFKNRSNRKDAMLRIATSKTDETISNSYFLSLKYIKPRR